VVPTLTSPASFDNTYLAAIVYWQHWSPFSESCCSVNDIYACNVHQSCASVIDPVHHPILSIKSHLPADMCVSGTMILADHGFG